MLDLPAIGITLGDVNGVGPEILIKALAGQEVARHCRPVIYGSGEVLDEAAAQLGLDWTCLTELRNSGNHNPSYRPGEMRAEAGAAAMAWVESAVRDAVSGEIAGIATCPISKEGIRAAGYPQMGHTDFIAELTGTNHYCMSLFAGPMRAIHATGHMALRDALERLNIETVVVAAQLADKALRRIGLERPRVAVAGLNPHAGENRLLGDEDLDIVAPAVARCASEGIDCTGPHPPDTVFWRMQRGDFDMVVALYHDQGHIPMKLIAMDYGVNVTLGIPIVRTSVDHGTAYDIAGKGLASERSLVEAVKLAAQLAGRP